MFDVYLLCCLVDRKHLLLLNLTLTEGSLDAQEVKAVSVPCLFI